MYRYVMLAALMIASANVFSQDAAAIAAQREAEERERRMNSLIENLQQANTVQQRRINDLFKEVGDLRRQLIEFENKYKNAQNNIATKTDISKAYEKMAEIEKNRQADNDLVKEQFKELKKLLDKPVYVPPVVAPVTPTRERPIKPDNGNETMTPDLPEFTGEYYPYKIKSGDSLTRIIAAYNAQLKEKGANKAPITLDMVKKANPKINANNLPVGKEIKIPIPPDK